MHVKDRAIVVLTAAIVVALGGASWIFLPSLQSSQRKLDEEVGKSAERARRIVAQFNAEADAAAEVVQRAGLTTDLTPERIEAIVTEDHLPAQAALDAESARLQEMLKGSVSRARQLDDTFTTLDPGAQLTPISVPSFGNSAEAVKRDLSRAAQDREKLISQNRSAVGKALAEVGQALSTQQGDAVGSDSFSANRLKGIALFQEAEASSRSAALHRQRVAQTLFELTSLARAHFAAESGNDLLDASDIAAAIQNRKASLSSLREQYHQAESGVRQLETQTVGLQAQIDEQDGIATRARQMMDELEARGLDYSQTDAAERFARDYGEAARAFRTAERRKHELRHGGLSNARIEATGDLVSGEFVPATSGGTIERVRGLQDIAGDLEVARKDLAGLAAQVDQLEAQLREAEGLRKLFEQRQSDATALTRQIAERIAASHKAYLDAEAAATEAEDLAIRKFADAAKAFNSAQRVQSAQVTNIPSELAPDALERSPYSLVQRSGFIGAEAKAEAADAELRAALVWHDRYDRLATAEAVLTDVDAGVSLAEWDSTVLTQRRTEARDQGLALAESATRSLESAARDLENHWTVAASIAAANYVMSLFDRPELRNLAIQNYNAAVQGREADPNVRPFKQRVDQLMQQQ